MKICLLNLPFDANYGGNLQRYALVRKLQGMGHDVTHIFLYYEPYLPLYKIPFIYFIRLIRKIFLGDKKKIMYERYLSNIKKKKLRYSYEFYNTYIPHTQKITKKKQLKDLPLYDAYVVGSDQVWRKSMTKSFGFTTFFLSFIFQKKSRRIAYACSFGTNYNEYSKKEITQIQRLYEKFDLVSVREIDGLELLQRYYCTIPHASLALDPTFLLTKEDYECLILNKKTEKARGDAFCYILDNSEEVRSQVQYIVNQYGFTPFFLDFNVSTPPSVEQWLSYFRDTKLVITDSYHGTVFSIIFKKPFVNLSNDFRGNSRIQTLRDIFGFDNKIIDYDQIDFARFKMLKDQSMNFLKSI